MKTGWPPGMLQDDCRELSKWLSTRVDSRHVAREAAKEIEMSKAIELADRLIEIAGDPMWADHAEISKRRLEITAAELRRLDAENAQLRAELEAIYSAEPVAWMRDDGEEGSLSTMTVCCSQKVKGIWLQCNPSQVKRYTLPLIPLPERKPK